MLLLSTLSALSSTRTVRCAISVIRESNAAANSFRGVCRFSQHFLLSSGFRISISSALLHQALGHTAEGSVVGRRRYCSANSYLLANMRLPQLRERLRSLLEKIGSYLWLVGHGSIKPGFSRFLPFTLPRRSRSYYYPCKLPLNAFITLIISHISNYLYIM